MTLAIAPDQASPLSQPPAALQAIVVSAIAPLSAAVLTTSVAVVMLRFAQCPSTSPDSSDSAIGDAINQEEAPPQGSDMTITENPSRIAFGAVEGSMYRGAVVGNLAILFASFLLLLIVGWVRFQFLLSPTFSSLPSIPNAAPPSAIQKRTLLK
ncbi:membrane-associated protein, putative [Bodo saltans]|uniref:Membrane-associated protein, putative n=1 Tax=Bodo saltans TaxID=75058 RepID=A0A0S4JAL0_BODSA|nr:membrane-associated protein, putative [Bodo saltans]|eukprot:CUG87264.1 membrane-associated protein, putative [Bodo saltans]